MNGQMTPHARNYVLLIALLVTPVTSVIAQSGARGSPPPTSKVNRERLRQQDMTKREYQLRNFGTEPPANASDAKQREALMLQTEQDFNRILFLHNQFVRATQSEQPLDYSFVSEAAAEIKKRASRLQGTLMLHESSSDHKDSAKAEVEGATMKDALIMLCKQIENFVTNPVIETPGTVNAEHLEKARHDLASVVKLSGEIKKDAEKLSKAPR